jgi:hypothetical protein
MAGVLDWFRRKRPRESRVGMVRIREFLRTWDGKEDLPDELPREDGRIRFAPGALEGMVRHHAQVGEGDRKTLLAIHRALERAREGQDDASRNALYEVLLGVEARTFADAVVEPLAGTDRRSLARVGRWLVEHGTHREPVKFGLLFLGLSAASNDLPLVKSFVRHGEFTSWAADAIRDMVDDPVPIWMEVAAETTGWARVEVVERIASEAGDRDDVSRWLLRHGTEGDYLDAYTAYRCAVLAKLPEVLGGGEPDAEVRTGVRRILDALIEGGPAEDLADYEDRGIVLDRYTGWMAKLEPSVEELSTLAAIARWLDSDKADAELRELLAGRTRAILEQPRSVLMIREAVRAADATAWPIAVTIGLDLWDDAFPHLALPTHMIAYWYQSLLDTADPTRIARVLAFAEQRLPLASIASGPKDSMGIGAEFQDHQTLGTIVHTMVRPEIFSAPLVAAALRSPMVNNRWAAMYALAAHPDERNDAIRTALARNAQDDPSPELRERARTALQ